MDELNCLERWLFEDVEGKVIDKIPTILIDSGLRGEVHGYFYEIQNGVQTYSTFQETGQEERFSGRLNIGDRVNIRLNRYLMTESKEGMLREIVEYETLSKTSKAPEE